MRQKDAGHAHQDRALPSADTGGEHCESTASCRGWLWCWCWLWWCVWEGEQAWPHTRGTTRWQAETEARAKLVATEQALREKERLYILEEQAVQQVARALCCHRRRRLSAAVAVVAAVTPGCTWKKSRGRDSRMQAARVPPHSLDRSHPACPSPHKRPSCQPRLTWTCRLPPDPREVQAGQTARDPEVARKAARGGAAPLPRPAGVHGRGAHSLRLLAIHRSGVSGVCGARRVAAAIE